MVEASNKSDKGAVVEGVTTAGGPHNNSDLLSVSDQAKSLSYLSICNTRGVVIICFLLQSGYSCTAEPVEEKQAGTMRKCIFLQATTTTTTPNYDGVDQAVDGWRWSFSCRIFLSVFLQKLTKRHFLTILRKKVFLTVLVYVGPGILGMLSYT